MKSDVTTSSTRRRSIDGYKSGGTRDCSGRHCIHRIERPTAEGTEWHAFYCDVAPYGELGS